MKTLILTIAILTSTLSWAADVTSAYRLNYESDVILDGEALEKLHETEIILIPGIVSEAFDSRDPRGVLDFSFIFTNYLEAQYENYRHLGISVTSLPGSSHSVKETMAQIDAQMNLVIGQGKKAVFITHSIGGLVLLDYLVSHNQKAVNNVSGIVFMQPPFHGSPIASVYFKNPYHARSVLGPIMPLVNTSEETVQYLTLESRAKVMASYRDSIEKLVSKLPMITAGGVSLDYPSVFRPSINLMGHGCVTVIKGVCRSRTLYSGPFDDSDGMVPFENSKLAGADYVRLEGVDHGEPGLAMPFKSVNRVRMTDALLKLVLDKQK